MKKTILFIAAIGLVVTLTSTSCHKKVKGCMDPISISYNPDAEESDGSCLYAGDGGNTTIVAKPQHHGMPITNKGTYPDTAFVKFNATNLPSSWDAVFVGDSGEDHVHIHDLKPGKYYIMMTGFDTTINQRVHGGIPYTLTQTAGEVDLVVPVSE